MARFKMHPFISTMANMLIIFGLVTYATKEFLLVRLIRQFRILLFHSRTFPMIILWAIVAIVLYGSSGTTTFGKNLYAVGGNPKQQLYPVSLYLKSQWEHLSLQVSFMDSVPGWSVTEWLDPVVRLRTGMGYGRHCSLRSWWSFLYRWYR